jgi:dolichol kinase
MAVTRSKNVGAQAGFAGAAPVALSGNGPGLTGATTADQVGIHHGAPWYDRISAAELRRRVWHISPGCLAVILWFVPHRDPISPTLQWVLFAIISLLALRIFVQYRLIRRTGERGSRGTAAVLGYAVSVMASLLLFPAQAEIGLAVLSILAFGDGAATLGGLLANRRPLPWNPEKTWAGLLSFLVVGTLTTAVIYWRETHNLEAQTPGVSFGVALLCAGLACGIAAIAESVHSRINDNIRVGIAAALGMVCAQSLFVGWS